MNESSWIRAFPAVAILLLVSAAPAICGETAEEAGSLSKEGIEYVEVNVSAIPESNTIATKLSTPQRLTPANVGSVTGTLFREQGAVVLSDALRNISGVNVQSGTGVFDFFHLRGYDSLTSGLVLTDGAPEPEATFHNLYNVEGIELMKGPAGFLYGSNPLAGVVNLVRKQPLPTNFGSAWVSGGSNATAEGRLDWNRTARDGDVAFRLNAMAFDTDNYRDGRDGKSWAVNPALTYRIDDRSSINFNVEFVDTEAGPDVGIPLLRGDVADVPRERSYQSPLDFSEQQTTRVQVDYETRLSDNLTLRNKTYFRGLDWDSDGTIFAGVLDLSFLPDPQLFRALTTLEDRQRFYGNQFEAVIGFGNGAVRHKLLAGLEVARQTDDFDIGFGELPAIGIFDPVETTTTVATTPLLSGASTATIVAPYLVDQIRLSDAVQVLVGARYDWIDSDVESSGAITGFQPSNRSSDEGKLSPMAGVVVAPSESTTFYFNAGESFAPPSSRTTDQVPGGGDPEESRQIEFGVKQRFLDGRLRATAAVYDMERENIAIPDATGVLQQTGDQQSRGFELRLSAEPTRRLHAFFNYAYNDSELTSFSQRLITGPGPTDFVVVDRTGNAPAFAPKHLASLWVTCKLRGPWGVGGGLRYIGTQFIAEDNGFETDASLVADATVSLNLERYRIRLSLKNLTDEEYETRGFGANSVTPASPFTAHVGVEYRF